MRRDEATRETKRALLSMAHPKSVGVPYDHWKEVLAEARFGGHRQNVMARKWIPLTVEKQIESLFSEVEDTPATTRVTPMHGMTMSMISSNEERRLLLPSTGRGLLPKSIVTGKTAVSVSLHSSQSNTVTNTASTFRQHLKDLREDEVTLKVGDNILYKGDGEENIFYQATIVSIDAEEEELEIRPLRNDVDADEDEEEVTPITRFVTINDIQFYRPLRENDLVWAFTENPETGDESWKIHEVLFISPFGQVDVLVSKEFLDLEDDDEDDIYSEPITLDVRDLVLLEDQIPPIRLRQY